MNLLSGLVSYNIREEKPSIDLLRKLKEELSHWWRAWKGRGCDCTVRLSVASSAQTAFFCFCTAPIRFGILLAFLLHFHIGFFFSTLLGSILFLLAFAPFLFVFLLGFYCCHDTSLSLDSLCRLNIRFPLALPLYFFCRWRNRGFALFHASYKSLLCLIRKRLLAF
jgi:hypothetical protein